MTRQLMLGQSAIIDDLIGDTEVVLWHRTAARFSAGLYLIECVCSDQAIHRARLEGRARGIRSLPLRLSSSLPPLASMTFREPVLLSSQVGSAGLIPRAAHPGCPLGPGER
jgi:hypothetical protein